MVDPKTWAKEIEQQRAQESNVEAQKQAAFIAKRALFNEEAPKLLPAVRDAFETFCAAYNKERDILYIADIGPKTFVVRRKDLPGVMLTIEGLSGHKLCVTANVGRDAKIYEPEVFENGHASVWYTSHGAPIAPDDIAAEALRPIARV